MNRRQSNAVSILREMDRVLDALIAGAEKLLDLSQRVIAEQELSALQAEQEVLLEQLLQHDQELHNCSDLAAPANQTLRKIVDGKIDLFQRLNEEFVEKISAVHGLIHFDQATTQKHAIDINAAHEKSARTEKIKKA